jgi:putative salt-induced outer membrane protein YdiY
MRHFFQKIIFVSALAAAALSARAEESAVLPRDWNASLYGGFAAKSGNTTEESYRYGGEFEKKNGKAYRYRLKMDGRYRETNDRLSESKTELFGEMRRMLNERWFAAGTVSVLHDDIRDISYRVKIGPGLGYYIADTGTLTADVSSGPLYVHEKTEGRRQDYLAWRFAQRLNWQITEAFRWWTSAEAVVDTRDTDAYTLTFKSGIESKINSHLSLLVLVENEYDSLPDAGPGIKKNDFEISTGLRYSF